ncbi:hypothetical protein PUN28_000617 [Cardiocondyla obscurior]|uniref:Secreted protein n=1 Tax=Cardiocondyla obscurior TaxID=286306 RepID=A0AAW2H0Q1_9HYME
MSNKLYIKLCIFPVLLHYFNLAHREMFCKKQVIAFDRLQLFLFFFNLPTCTSIRYYLLSCNMAGYCVLTAYESNTGCFRCDVRGTVIHYEMASILHYSVGFVNRRYQRNAIIRMIFIMSTKRIYVGRATSRSSLHLRVLNIF